MGRDVRQTYKGGIVRHSVVCFTCLMSAVQVRDRTDFDRPSRLSSVSTVKTLRIS